jgi:hypothetical protein
MTLGQIIKAYRETNSIAVAQVSSVYAVSTLYCIL